MNKFKEHVEAQGNNHISETFKWNNLCMYVVNYSMTEIKNKQKIRFYFTYTLNICRDELSFLIFNKVLQFFIWLYDYKMFIEIQVIKIFKKFSSTMKTINIFAVRWILLVS